MKYLIDTHTFIWFNEGNTQLSKVARQLIENPNNEIYISIASLWEISIKVALKKLEIAGSYESVLDDVTNAHIKILPIEFNHTVGVNKLPLVHKDPFDRMIVSQALYEQLDLLSGDDNLDPYFNQTGFSRIW
ncbi:type II toxin-antitoxin system VapC family toxin [Dyadobacter sp. MSC1_007]|jgi:PIN domain nuclease of toxin-antitoxin system|uniref:type II toxin-antitoxin system VapC family toxin n=1 Tax=Dyadobacter sp. MSC1_007 TaxID=2909264 RepID=UPI002030DEEF|nr:type II toxin-antitoxin system VapC family toxin [Dyadobacter sp. MSC1_007]